MVRAARGESANSADPAGLSSPLARAQTSHLASLDPKRCVAILGSLREISTAAADVDGCGRLLEIVSRELRAEQAAILLCNPLTRGLEFIVHNQDPSFPRMYADYYGDLDPTHLADYVKGHSALPSSRTEPTVFDLMDVVDYDSLIKSEFYNDFWSLGGIHYDLVAVMASTPLARGALCLHRGHESDPFSSEEAGIMEFIAPFIANHLEKLVSASVLSALQMSDSKGVIVCDTDGRVLYCNEVARDLCSSLDKTGGGSPRLVKEMSSPGASFVGFTLSDLQALADSCGMGIESREIMLDRGDPGVLVSLERREDETSCAREPLKARFALTDREIEVLERVMAGGSNREIAQALFIAEATVKKHMQSIADKVGPRSRTGIAHAIMQELKSTA